MQKYALPAVAAALMALGAAQGFAQGGADAATKARGPHTAASIECSQQADAKGLHGTARRHFRSQCMRGMAKGKAPSQNPLGYRSR
jgi:hypothetical protein